MRRLRGLKALVHDAIDVTTHLVREGHESSARAVMRVTDRVEPIAGAARDVDALRRVSTDAVLGAIRLVNRGVEHATDVGLDLAQGLAAAGSTDDEIDRAIVPAMPLRSDVMGTGAFAGDAALAVVNAVVGDHLGRRENGLDLGMHLRFGDSYVDMGSPRAREAIARAYAAVAKEPRPRVVVFVHGLGTTEWSWCLEAAAYHGDPSTCFATLLERDAGTASVFVRYNTGRHISENGRSLSGLLEALCASYPVPIEEIVLVGHSMGGLVLRSACHYGDHASATAPAARWVRSVRRIVCLGSPHRGAPLEKVGNLLTGVLGAIDLPGTLIPARILEGRSAGIKDLRHGSLVDEDWQGRDPDALIDEARREIPLLPDVAYHFVSATLTRDPEHPLGRLIGDLLVRVPSAEGPVVSQQHFTRESVRLGGILHHQIQNHPEIYELVRDAIGPGARPTDASASEG